MPHILETIQAECETIKKRLKVNYGPALGKQLIAGAEESVDYSYQAERNVEWWVKYRSALEERL